MSRTIDTAIEGDFAVLQKGPSNAWLFRPVELPIVASALSCNPDGTPLWVAVATAAQGTKADSAVQPGSLATVATSGAYGDLISRPVIPSNTNQLTNGAGFITGITSGNVTAALGFTPYNATNPNSFIDLAGARLSITFTTTGTGAATYNSGNGALNVPNTTPAAIVINDVPGRSIVTTTTSTGFQIDASRACEVHYDIDLSTTASIAGNAAVSVYLETAATNSTTAGDWTSIAKVTNTQALSLAITLQSIQGVTMSFNRKIPAGKYVRLRSVISGTASATIAYAQETKL